MWGECPLIPGSSARVALRSDLRRRCLSEEFGSLSPRCVCLFYTSPLGNSGPPRHLSFFPSVIHSVFFFFFISQGKERWERGEGKEGREGRGEKGKKGNM